MTYPIIVRPEAQAELTAAFEWYEKQVPGLGGQFLLTVDAVFCAMSKNPLQYPNVYKNIRRALTRRFPFQIFYLIEDSRIVVLAVFHGMRNPTTWQDRN